MPFFIPPLVVAALAGLGVIGAAAVATSLWPQTKGLRLLVIGNTGSGKTTLVNFLSTGTIPEETRKTANTTTNKVEGGEVRMGDLELKVDCIWDTAGDEEVTWRAWLDKSKEADEILYLIHIEKAASAEHAVTIRRDAQQIAMWRRDGDLKDSCRVFLVVTHCDKLAGFEDLDPRNEGATSTDWARTTPGVATALKLLGPNTGLVAGSLMDDGAAGRLVLRLLETVAKPHD